MQSSPSHLLSKLGVLAAFTISKKVTPEEFAKVYKKLEKYKNNKKKFESLLTNELLKNTKKSLEENKLPGIIIPEINEKQELLTKFYSELTIIATSLANKFKENQLTNHQLCFIINALINIFELDEHDFTEFHRKFSEYQEGNSDQDI